jgi:hypothetical protein
VSAAASAAAAFCEHLDEGAKDVSMKGWG